MIQRTNWKKVALSAYEDIMNIRRELINIFEKASIENKEITDLFNWQAMKLIMRADKLKYGRE